MPVAEMPSRLRELRNTTCPGKYTNHTASNACRQKGQAIECELRAEIDLERAYGSSGELEGRVEAMVIVVHDHKLETFMGGTLLIYAVCHFGVYSLAYCLL